MQLDAIPVLAAGKPDRSALRSMAADLRLELSLDGGPSCAGLRGS